jgi:Domain of unknown function (DUF4157)
MGFAPLARKADATPSPQTAALKKLRIGDPDDAFEREADRVADEILAPGAPRFHWLFSKIPLDPPVQRKCPCGGSGECEECQQKEIQRKATGGAGSAYAPPIVYEALGSPGKPLDSATHGFFESWLGANLDRVRIHTGDAASRSARAIAASAYTVGNQIVFDTGRYSPESQDGKRLLAHELTHVLQQEANGVVRRQGRTPQPQTRPQSRSAWGPGDIGIATLRTDRLVCGTGGRNWGQHLWTTSGCAPLCAQHPIPFLLAYIVDFKTDPRPQPFTPPRVSGNVEFIPKIGGPSTVLVKGTGSAQYQSAGTSVKTPFNNDLSFFTPPGPGTLNVVAIISDNDSGEVATYTDQIPVEACPAAQGAAGKGGIPVPRSPLQLGRIIFVPDPDGDPFTFIDAPAAKSSVGSNTKGIWTQIQRDEDGDFYIYEGKKYYIRRSEKRSSASTSEPGAKQVPAE